MRIKHILIAMFKQKCIFANHFRFVHGFLHIFFSKNHVSEVCIRSIDWWSYNLPRVLIIISKFPPVEKSKKENSWNIEMMISWVEMHMLWKNFTTCYIKSKIRDYKRAYPICYFSVLTAEKSCIFKSIPVYICCK